MYTRDGHQARQLCSKARVAAGVAEENHDRVPAYPTSMPATPPAWIVYWNVCILQPPFSTTLLSCLELLPPPWEEMKRRRTASSIWPSSGASYGFCLSTPLSSSHPPFPTHPASSVQTRLTFSTTRHQQ